MGVRDYFLTLGWLSSLACFMEASFSFTCVGIVVLLLLGVMWREMNRAHTTAVNDHRMKKVVSRSVLVAHPSMSRFHSTLQREDSRRVKAGTKSQRRRNSPPSARVVYVCWWAIWFP